MKEIEPIRTSKSSAQPIPLTMISKESCCAAPIVPKKEAWVSGYTKTPLGNVPIVTTELTLADHLGEIKARISSFRNDYSIKPGLYAIGEPNSESDVFVSANYKLSFDKLRSALKGMNGWILVLDTKGINVWCAAGKGTFGTTELINRIFSTQLYRIVDHKRIIVPQLGAVGVNAKEVKDKTKFKVKYGPVYAKDLRDYVKAKYKATSEMRRVRFSIIDRLVLTPMEINPAMKKYFPLFALVILLIFGLQPSGVLFAEAFKGGLPFLLLGLLTIFSGGFLTPVLLPFVPFRSFAIKGWLLGALTIYLGVIFLDITNLYLMIAAYIFFPLASSYIALQFTGSTTYTGMSGVNKELKLSLPIYFLASLSSIILLVLFKLTQWRVI